MPLFPPLVDAETLTAQLGNPALRIFDATVHLRRAVEGGQYTVDTGWPAYQQAHLPGAAFADIPGKLSDTRSSYPFALPSAGAFAAAAGSLGIGDLLARYPKELSNTRRGLRAGVAHVGHPALVAAAVFRLR